MPAVLTGVIRSRLAALALFAGLAILHTWPLATSPGTLSRNSNADTVLNEWIVAWVAHQAPRNPSRLWDANIFYPEHNTLAYSEPLLTPAAIGAPLLWLGQSPVFVYNVLILVGLTLTGWTTWLLLSRWTGDSAAGVLGGVIVAFNAHTLTRLPQLQALHIEFMPLALLMLDAVLAPDAPVARRLRHAALLACCVVLQGATSYYTLVFTSLALVLGWLVRPRDWIGAKARTVLPALACAAVAAVVLLLPVLLPYRRLGHVRTLEEVGRYSATLSSYLASPARVHYPWWSADWFASSGDTALFPGVVASVLAIVAVAAGIAWRDSRARMAVAFGLAGAALSFGPSLPGFATLFAWVPPLQGIRNAARYGFLLTLALAILSAFAAAWLRQRWRHARWLPAATVATIALANLDALAAPISYVPPDRIAGLHATLRDTDAVVAHIPFYTPDRLFRNAPYMLESTANWRPILNGYSGFVPETYVQHARAFATFPDANAIDALRAAGVTHVFVHDRALRDWTDNETADAVRTSPALQQIAREGDLTLYTLARK
jgi:hypothetical protein